MQRILALNNRGLLTYCTAPEELRGKGRCNHIAHQNPGESQEDTINRFDEIIKNIKIDDVKNGFIPLEGTTVETSQYKISEEEKANLVKIENKMQLEENIEGAYIHLDFPIWNDMDKNSFTKVSNMTVKGINSVLDKEEYVVIKSELKNYPIGKVCSLETKEKVEPLGVEFGTGLEALNKVAKFYDFEATTDVYVLPYYMRINNKEDILDSEGNVIGETVMDSDITGAYQYLFRNRNNPDGAQYAYSSLLNNAALGRDKARYNKGYQKKSLSDMFAGKGGVFRAYLSGNSVPYTARSVITPSVDVEYGEIKIPPSVAVDIYKPTIIRRLSEANWQPDDIDKFCEKYRARQDSLSESDYKDLEDLIYDRRVFMNRQPSLHTSSLQSFRPRISHNATTQIHPLYCSAFGADFDGDTVTLGGINADYIIPIVDKEIDASKDINVFKPGARSSLSIKPSKDSVWGLLNILSKRSN